MLICTSGSVHPNVWPVPECLRHGHGSAMEFDVNSRSNPSRPCTKLAQLLPHVSILGGAMTQTEASVRNDLAAVYRICHKLGLNEGVLFVDLFMSSGQDHQIHQRVAFERQNELVWRPDICGHAHFWLING